MKRYAEVVFPLPVDTSFTYHLPDDIADVQIGQRVLAPFSRRTMTGYVVGLPSEAGDVKTKTIHAVLDDSPLLTPELLAIARAMAQKCCAPLGEAIQTMLPPGLIRESRKKIMAVSKTGEPIDIEEAEWLAKIRKNKGLDWSGTLRRHPNAQRIFRRLEKEGWISIQTAFRKERTKEKEIPYEVDHANPFAAHTQVELSKNQLAAYETITHSMLNRKPDRFLLYGITGSGKTEIYLQAAKKALELGRTVLALVPEISLTPQFVGRFQSRFGGQVAWLHSGRTDSERLSEWRRIRKKQAPIVIGARSAVFAPLENIGLVVVDEEHDASYKQEEGLLYNAREIAKLRAERENAVLVLGSATPSLETYEGSQAGETTLLELPKRAKGQELPIVEIIDLRKEISWFGQKGFISNVLREEISRTLTDNEQVVLFLNRRGYAPIILCPKCGESLRCDSCSVTLTFHEESKSYLCHYCGQVRDRSLPCGHCKHVSFIHLGMGTERIEEELRFMFPDARIARMDRDAMRGKREHEKLMRALAKREVDILIGTQMVTKGMDFEHVALVGVLLADQGLNFPDFRAAERTFQLLTQVVGRAGRGKKRGRAVFQTFQPNHYAVLSAAAQDYRGFFNREIEYRKQAGYPPFGFLHLFELKGKDPEDLRLSAQWLARQAKLSIERNELSVEILGPSPAPIKKVRDFYRYHLILKSLQKKSLEQNSRWLFRQAEPVLRDRKIQTRLDVDPYHFL